jgi:single-strand DNA-binding protein
MPFTVNRVILGGNLTRDPEVKFVGDSTALCNFSIAVNERFKKRSGEYEEKVHYFDCTAWGKTAENIGRFFTKGKPIFIEGKLQLERWENNQGEQRHKVGVRVENFEFVGGREDRSDPPTDHGRRERAEEFSNDDLPF